jgi:hypothetical protein
MCHGNPTASGASAPPALAPVRLAMQHTGVSASDAPRGVMQSTDSAQTQPWLAFAPPFGPNLKGVYGRPAGSVKDFQYSSVFVKTLKGMEWNDASLDVWITNTQAWVPGVYMFYKQPDAQIRRKIILYLKANR